MTAGNYTLAAWNALPADEAIAAILPTNGSRAWAEAMAAQRPFASPRNLLAAADRTWRNLDANAWQQAFDAHPRIGESHAQAADPRSLSWSRGEQAAAVVDAAALTEIAEGNRAYEEKFGRIFLVSASGKTAGEILQILERRLHNDADTELHEAAEQQRQITQLRLRKWLELQAAKEER